MAGIFLYSFHRATAQISPGELSTAHESLEGISHCTSCHTVGRTLANDKCLACHSEIGSRISAARGYHAHLAGRLCADCHKEHHGRDFSIVRFDTRSFDHSRDAGFALDGRHARIQCRECHKPEHVKASDVLKLGAARAGTTYLGLPRECTGCHRDVHEERLSADCRTCHSTEAWKPAPLFSHDRTRYPLTGRHADVACVKCHTSSSNQPAALRVSGLRFSSCEDCHRDPHAGRFKKSCEACHSTQGWQLAGRNFDHARTAFPLRGRHASVSCQKCHGEGRGTAGFHIARFQACSDCHSDVHQGQFARLSPGKTCATCHVETGWSEGAMRTFDHSSTRFPLRGRHASVACGRCHEPSKALKPGEFAVNVVEFGRCANCHPDPHVGQFSGPPRDCADCHREEGFVPSTFTLEMHARTGFPLDGAHMALPCLRCHGSAVSRIGHEFRKPAGKHCRDCHKDPHGAQLARWTASGCATCHATNAWNQVDFAHDQTTFPLEGKHRGLSCGACHRTGSGSVEGWRFAGTPRACESCHGKTTKGG